MPRRSRSNRTQPEIEPNTIVAAAGRNKTNAKFRTTPEDDPTPSSAWPNPPSGKLAMLLDRVSYPAGATIDELIGATGWQPHTVRAAFSRLRKRGFPIALVTDADGRKVYLLDPKEG